MEGYVLVRKMEPVLFALYGLVNTSALWAFFSRSAFAGFWVHQMRVRSPFYCIYLVVMGLAGLWGIGIWLRDLGHNYWWRWLFLPAGIVAAFNAVAGLLRLWWWQALLLVLYDTTSPLWLFVWGALCVFGVLCLLLAVYLLRRRKRQKDWLAQEG